MYRRRSSDAGDPNAENEAIVNSQTRRRFSRLMRYVGQGHETEVAVPLGPLSSASLAVLNSNFETAYRALYHLTIGGGTIEAPNWRLRISGPTPAIGLWRHGDPFESAAASRPTAGNSSSNKAANSLKGKRLAYFPEHGFT